MEFIRHNRLRDKQATRKCVTKKLRVAIPSEGVRVAFCSELQKATFYKFPEFAFTFIISCMNC